MRRGAGSFRRHGGTGFLSRCLQGRRWFLRKALPQGVVEILRAGGQVMRGAVIDGAAERRKQFSLLYLLDLADCLAPERVAGADARAELKILCRPAALNGSGPQTIYGLHRSDQAAGDSLRSAVAAHGKEILERIQVVEELIPGGHRAQREAAKGPASPRGPQSLISDVRGIGAVIALDKGEKMVLQVLVKNGQFLQGPGEILGLILRVKGGADDEDGRNIPGFNHAVQQVLRPFWGDWKKS